MLGPDSPDSEDSTATSSSLEGLSTFSTDSSPVVSFLQGKIPRLIICKIDPEGEGKTTLNKETLIEAEAKTVAEPRSRPPGVRETREGRFLRLSKQGNPNFEYPDIYSKRCNNRSLFFLVKYLMVFISKVTRTPN
jgi:hypothetical protein